MTDVVDAREPKRNYPIPYGGVPTATPPVPSNDVDADLARLVLALTAIGVDVDALFTGLAGKAPTSHTHAMSAISGLVEALLNKAAYDHSHALGDLSNVNVAGAAAYQVLARIGSAWVPWTIDLSHVTGSGILRTDTAQSLSDAEKAIVQANIGLAGLLAGYVTSSAMSSAISTAISNLVGGAGAALDTLKEIETALGNDANFAASMVTALASKQASNSFLTTLATLGPSLTAGDLIQATGANAVQRVPSSSVGSVNDIAMLAMELADLKNSTVLAAGWWAESCDTLTTFNSGGSTNVDTGESGALKNTVTAGPNEIPAMTSNGPQSGVTVSASVENVGGGGREAFRAFDDNVGTIWAANALSTDWLKVAFSAAKTIVNYDVSALSGYQPQAWVLEGSNDNSAWTAIDTRTGQTLTASTTYTYAVTSPGSYLYYRFRVTAAVASAGIWQEINLYSTGTKNNADIRFVPQDIGSVPTTLDIYAAVQQTDALTFGTDFLVYGTRNNAATWTQSGAISVIGTVGGATIIKATVTVSGQSSGQLVAPRFVTANNKNFKLLGHFIAGRS